MFSVVIQAGGKSLRMGADKAYIPFRGQALIERVASRLAPLTDDLLIISNPDEKLKTLGYPVYPDRYQGFGPLAGLFTGLLYARHPIVGMVACDMPFVNPTLLEREATLLDALDVDVVIPSFGGKAEPLHAVYRKGSCLPVIEAGLIKGMRRLVEWHSGVKVHLMGLDEILRYDPQGVAFLNLNTPEDLIKYEGYDLD